MSPAASALPRAQSWTRWVKDQSWPVRILVGVIGFIFVCAIVWASVRLSFGINLITVVTNWLARH